MGWLYVRREPSRCLLSCDPRTQSLSCVPKSELDRDRSGKLRLGQAKSGAPPR
jgi:hypothetical protein